MLYLNFMACVLFVNKLSGTLAARMHLRSSFFDAFTDIGSSHAKSFLLAKLARASAEPVAAQLRAEVDGPSAAAVSSDVAPQSIEAAVTRALESVLPRMTAAMLEQQARHHGVLEIARSRVTSFSKKLLAIGTPVDDSHLPTIAAEGGALHVSVFLRDMGVHHDLIRRLTPTFSLEVGRRKLAQHTAADPLNKPPLWIAWSQGAWRVYYTEADRALLCAVFEDPLTKQNLEQLQKSCQASHPAAPTVARRRSGPYSRALRGGSGEISSGGIQRFFQQQSSA